MKNKYKNYNKATETTKETAVTDDTAAEEVKEETATVSYAADTESVLDTTAVTAEASTATVAEKTEEVTSEPLTSSEDVKADILITMVNASFAQPVFVDNNRMECKASCYTNLEAYHAAKSVDLGFTITLPKDYRAVLVLHDSLSTTPVRIVGDPVIINPAADGSAVPVTILMEAVPKIHEIKMYNGAVRQDTHERTTYEIQKDDVVCTMYFEKIATPVVFVKAAETAEA